MKKVQKDWILKPFEANKINELKNELKISHVICKLLVQRGIYSYDQAKTYFRPKLEQLHDPFLMKGMEKACNRICAAIDSNESILIYGDYDVDGTTAVSLIYTFLNPLNQNIEYYIPDRYEEGYGISEKSINYASEKNINLIICLDCGITNLEEVEMASKKDIDVIICDHHLPEKTLPKAFSILNPKQKGCKYPFKELSGCGVGFKLIQGVSIKKGLSQDIAFGLLDLLAISIACDMVSVSGENRILAYFGLQLLNKRPRPGIKCILNTDLFPNKTIQKEFDLRFTDLAFKIGTKINAAGRMGDAKDAVRLLLSVEYKAALEYYNILKERNQDRKQKQNTVIEIAIESINNSPDLLNKNSMVLYDDSWHKGVIGIAASKLIEHFFKPTVIFAGNDAVITGSARSIPGINIHKAIGDCSKWLIRFGGHKMAAGLSIKRSNLTLFADDFEKAINKQMSLKVIKPELHIDTELTFDEISPSLIKIIKQMEPFGPDNSEPVFISKGLFDTGLSRVVKKEHLKLNIKQKGANKLMNGIAFNQSKAYDMITKNNNFALCYSLYENTWQNNKSIELMVKDFSFKNESNYQ